MVEKRAASENERGAASPGKSNVHRKILTLFALLAFGCSAEPDGTTQELRLDSGALRLGPREAEHEDPARDHTLFEADPVRPIAVLRKSGLVAVVNTVDDSLELLRPNSRFGSWGPQKRGARTSELEACRRIKVGMRPVAVAVVEESRLFSELWVVNHLSDSISVVHVRPRSCRATVVDTLHVGDEPRDIVVTQNASEQTRVFVTTAHRGQHHPVESARSGADLVNAPHEKEHRGLADVFVFDPQDPTRPLSVVNLFTDTPRALSVGRGVVYAAGFHTGNRTTALPGETVALRGTRSLASLLARAEDGRFVEADGQLVLAEGAQGAARIEGGLPAVVGKGRCMPDPRTKPDEAFTLEVCVKTDDQHRVMAAHLLAHGNEAPDCRCNGGDGALQPATGLIVQFFGDAASCGDAYTTFPDGTSGCWLDAHPDGVKTPAEHASEQSPAMAWNDQVKLSLPDQDVFAIDVESLNVRHTYESVGTTIFGMATRPDTGDVFVLNTDAQNLTRFEGVGENSSTTVRGHLAESRITLLRSDGAVEPVHLNTHIDYGECCERNPQIAGNSLAFPTAGTFSSDGAKFFATALGSDKVFVLDAAHFDSEFDNSEARKKRQLLDLFVGDDTAAPSGPVGLALSNDDQQLFVKTHFSNELLVLDPQSGRVQQRIALPSPEAPSIRKGRHVLYNARLTSAHGDSACASCHIFGNFDSLPWDLGDPELGTVNNPGPFALAPENISLFELANNPAAPTLTPDFRANKGPMTTQTLRGMANHGAQHWRGDRTRNFQDLPGRHPDFGSLSENNSFGEFDVAIFGLNGNDALLDRETFQDFTNFALQITLPPNPVRKLDDTLSEDQAAGRALFFGCQSQSDEQFALGECISPSGELAKVDAIAEQCQCAFNPFSRIMDLAFELHPAIVTVKDLLSAPDVRSGILARAGQTDGIPEELLREHASLVEQLDATTEQLSLADLSLDERNMIPLSGAAAVSSASGSLLALLGFFAELELSTGIATLEVLLDGVPPELAEPGSGFESPEAFTAALPNVFAAANVTIRVQQDEALRETGEFHNLLLDCSIGTPKSCDGKVTDNVHTCHGCHTLDPQGNSEFDVYRPGFFGSDGRYSFENESQVMKVPHLRNLYAKVGMFGRPQSLFTIPESLGGPEAGGLFAPENAFLGPQVRGSGFMHDGAMDTVHRFFGAGVFVAVPGDDLLLGNPDGFDAFVPEEASYAQCVSTFRNADLSVLPPLDPSLTEALEFCTEASGLPESCFFATEDQECQTALALFAELLNQPEFPQIFSSQILPACFQLGSTLEGGQKGGACYPQGHAQRAQMEAFIMAFDTNLKPMVGQQVTIRGRTNDTELLKKMIRSAQAGHCDIAAFVGDEGYVMTQPLPDTPWRSAVAQLGGRVRHLGALVRGRRGPVTLTCYPPQRGQAEAWAATR